MLVLTHGRYEIPRHFQGHHNFVRDQRLRLETPGWRVLDSDGNPLPEDELQRQREKIMLAPLVVRDPEYPFREDLNLDASMLPVANAGASFVIGRCTSIGRKLRSRGKFVGAIRADSQSDQYNCCLVSR